MDKIEDMKDEVKEEVEASEPETVEEVTEQRTDDYDGLARRIDDVLDKLDSISDAVARVESMYAAFVESGATVRETSDDISEAVVEDSGLDDMADDEVIEFSIDDLDLSL